jgi:hypothetical protein
MNIIKEVSLDEKGLEKSTAKSEQIMDFPSISKENNPEVLARYIAAHARESNANIQDENVHHAPEGIKGKRTRINTESEAAGAKAKKQRVAKSEATKHDNASVSTPKRKRGKGDTSITKEEVKLALEEMEAEEQKPRKRKQAPEQIVSPMFMVTPAIARMAKEQADKLLAEQKDKVVQYAQERDEKLKAIGLKNCDEFFVKKIVEVKAIAGEAAEGAVEEAQIGLGEIQETSEAGASGSVPKAVSPESTSEADNSVKVTQISEPLITISPSSSIPTEDTIVLDNLESHCKGELPGVTSEKAFEVAPMEVASESPQQQPPEPQMTSTPQIPQPTQHKTIPDFEPIQNQTLSVFDQYSSSSNIQIHEQPPLDILKSEYIESELLKISTENASSSATKKSSNSIYCL